jgi:hypothetical protein
VPSRRLYWRQLPAVVTGTTVEATTNMNAVLDLLVRERSQLTPVDSRRTNR